MVKERRLAQMQAYSKSKSFMITTPIKEGEGEIFSYNFISL